MFEHRPEAFPPLLYLPPSPLSTLRKQSQDPVKEAFTGEPSLPYLPINL